MMNEGRISVMLSARFVRVPGLRSQFQSSPKASQLLGGPCDGDVPCFAEIISGAVKQLEVLKEHWDCDSSSSPGHQLSLSPQTVLGALWVSVAQGEIHVEVEPGVWQIIALALRVTFGPWITGIPSPLIAKETGQCVLSISSAFRKAEFSRLQA